MSIISNPRASRDYFLADRFEAGLVLQGWEVKALLGGRAQLVEARVILNKGEAYLINCNITPLLQADRTRHLDPCRSRKLLLRATELRKLVGKVQQAGYTLVPIAVHMKNRCLKLDIALAKGKKKQDKRETIKRREWNRDKQRLLATRSKRGPGRS